MGAPDYPRPASWSLPRTPEGQDDQRLGIAGAVMVDALLVRLYDGTLVALALPDGSIRVQARMSFASERRPA